ncbi:hypothetical protein ANTQUA_LOCUS6766 [Anthophora quadrimaculata]
MACWIDEETVEEKETRTTKSMKRMCLANFNSQVVTFHVQSAERLIRHNKHAMEIQDVHERLAGNFAVTTTVERHLTKPRGSTSNVPTRRNMTG